MCPGGEAAFVGAMVADSTVLRGRVHWYTAMLGRKASLKALRAALHRVRPTALRTTEFAQGTRCTCTILIETPQLILKSGLDPLKLSSSVF